MTAFFPLRTPASRRVGARPPFDDVRVRRAVDLAVDRDGYIGGVLQDGGDR